ncbi:thioredoxin domain-containing protein [Microvirga tunisiensis]|uniref:Thioredoxin domain-containing protein n=2 Tax=Pannonibacter tanglangensis TaxID=2750084 RepID=A0ABW9ZC16_9HYPH|nr:MULTISPECIES: DsbA family protein [unclassified Pannonibacter]NBN62360.1 thioredoxin domain-containing protein [Pannonibacter sp. XCT-34]NBN78027.1 thioredoxin domain-containing protein [Pannonibacter sp. XCT-53]
MKRLIAAVAGALMFLPLLAAPLAAQTPDKAAIEAIVKEYLLANPEVVRDALIELDRREKAAAEAAAAKLVSDNSSLLFNSTRQVVLGNPKGDVTLVEFFDYNCGYCKRALSDMERLIEEDKNLRVVLKEFPVLGQPSIEAAQVAIAVNIAAPEKYADFHAALLGNRGKADMAVAVEMAKAAGVTQQDLEKAMASGEVMATLEEVYGLANQLGLTGTPAYVIGKDVIPGAVGYDTLKETIAAVRKCGQSSC